MERREEHREECREEHQNAGGAHAQDEEICHLGKEQRRTHEDMGVLMETIREMAVTMAQL